MLSNYVKEISKTYIRGDAREETYYPTLKILLEKYAKSINKNNVHVTTLPKKTEAGNPDFRVWDGKQKVVGYIEAKMPDRFNLDLIEETDQLQRYLSTFPNVILTNFLEFRLYKEGNLIKQALIGRPAILKKLKTEPPLEKEKELFDLLNKFYSFSFPKIKTAKSLAIELAKRTKFLRDEVVNEELKVCENNFIHGFFDAFKKYLISGLTPVDFADIYSQTITYGLFAARTKSIGDFNRKLAYDKIPKTIGILKDVFQFISLGSVPQQMEWIIDDISEVLAVTDVKKLLHDYFHETFLAEYDPKAREKRGVYYTPEPVVSYIVRSLNIILKEKFGKEEGFADTSVTVLDPAAGTLTFLAEASKIAVDEYASRYGEGGKDRFIKEHILKNFYAFEIMMAPYAVGHLKMSFLLEELGYELQPDDRFKLYLTNTLEMEQLEQTDLPGMASLSEESHLAGKVKKDQPILVILGNPPYSVSSSNKSDFIEKEMDLYKEDVRNERNIQPLSDDYIKFIRFAHWKIDKSGQGLIGLITNNHYLSGSIHRGMRKKLMDSFNEIYILNLHGNSRIGEKCPDGSPDENVFDIQQGVAVSLFEKNNDESRESEVYYRDVWGLRENKYQYLETGSKDTTKWTELLLSDPNYFFVEKDFSLKDLYYNFLIITDIFIEYSSGVKTHRDHFVVGNTSREVEQKMQTFVSELPDDFIKEAFKLRDTRNWTVKNSRKIMKESQWEKTLYLYCYRPFDVRYICYQPSIIDRDRLDFMSGFFNSNLGLALKRSRYINVFDFKHAFVTATISDINFFGDQTYYFTLYSPEKNINSKGLFEKTNCKVDTNFYPSVIEIISKFYSNKSSSEQIFYYIYSVLYSDIYRTKYAEFLKIDFPRIPFTKDFEVFSKMAELGKQLVSLHLLNSKDLNNPIAKFQEEGDKAVDKISYNDGKVFINKTQYFEGIEPEVYEYQIGGYQVCNKWLKDRKGRYLSLDDIKHYCKVVTALKKTIEIQQQIDEIYPEVEKDIIEFGD